MKKMRKVTLLLIAIMTAAILGGCGNSFDASGYVKALLDNSYKGDSTEFVNQKVGTKEQAEELYKQGIDAEMSSLSMGAEVPEELQAEFREVLEDIFKNVKYTVGDATKKDDSYEVEVKYQKMNIFAPTMEKLTEMASADGATDEDAQVIELLKDAMKEVMGSVTYGDEETTTIRIELVNKLWTPNEEDITKLEELLFDLEAVTGAE